VSWRVGGLAVLREVSLEVTHGELLAVIGPNGAGKTSLFNVITGLLPPTAGRIELDGRDITRLPAHRRVPLGLGRTFQTSSVFGSMTVRENVELAAQAAIGGPWRALAPWSRISAAARDTAAAALDRTRLTGRADDRAATLSHGTKRKLELALVLASGAAVVLLDEPMAGMAIEEVPDLTELIREVHRAGTTVLMVEHHMEVVLGLADRIAVLHHGELIACGTPADVTADAAVRVAYLGEQP
jgi:branched-chain amino acid transport system ATP-binding protein